MRSVLERRAMVSWIIWLSVKDQDSSLTINQSSSCTSVNTYHDWILVQWRGAINGILNCRDKPFYNLLGLNTFDLCWSLYKRLVYTIRTKACNVFLQHHCGLFFRTGYNPFGYQKESKVEKGRNKRSLMLPVNMPEPNQRYISFKIPKWRSLHQFIIQAK